MSSIKKLKQRFKWGAIKWLLVGLGTFAIDYFFFILLFGPIKSVVLANSISGSASIAFNYFAHHYWTFEGTKSHRDSGWKYIIYLVGLWVLGTLVLKGLIVMNINPKIAKVIPVFVTTPISYFALRNFVFKAED